MSDRHTTIIARCEDIQQRVFLYRCLLEKGVHPRAVDIAHCRGGDAKAYVREQHVAEVRVMRAKPHLTIGVVSMIDADDASVEQRKRDLDKALVASGQSPRQPGERVAILVPRRNIETWIHCLLGKTVNETDEYPRFRGEEKKCGPAAKEFAKRCSGGMAESDPASMKDGCAELTKFIASARP